MCFANHMWLVCACIVGLLFYTWFNDYSLKHCYGLKENCANAWSLFCYVVLSVLSSFAIIMIVCLTL